MIAILRLLYPMIHAEGGEALQVLCLKHMLNETPNINFEMLGGRMAVEMGPLGRRQGHVSKNIALMHLCGSHGVAAYLKSADPERAERIAIFESSQLDDAGFGPLVCRALGLEIRSRV